MDVGIEGSDGRLMLDKLGTLGLKFLTAATALTGAAVIPAWKIEWISLNFLLCQDSFAVLEKSNLSLLQ